jgi:ABC-type Mn2+/Zn2+ transport system permease subunit
MLMTAVAPAAHLGLMVDATGLVSYLNSSAVPFKVWIIVVAVLISATCSLLSTYVVLRKMALIAEGVSHAGFGGLALAVFLGAYIHVLDTPPYGPYLQQAIAGVFCVVTALLIGYFARAKKVSEDSAIGIFLVASIAAGVMLLALRRSLHGAQGVPVSAEQLLFGSATSVVFRDAVNSLLLALGCFGAVYLFYYELLYTTLDEQMARVNGVSTTAINLLLYIMISLVVVVGIRMVGGLMITALAVLPGATANMISRRFGGVMLASLIVGVGGSVTAICLALYTPLSNYPPGPILVLTLFVIFLLVWLGKKLVRPALQVDAPPAT